MPNLKTFKGDREAFNAYYRAYTAKNLDKVRKIKRDWYHRAKKK